MFTVFVITYLATGVGISFFFRGDRAKNVLEVYDNYAKNENACISSETFAKIGMVINVVVFSVGWPVFLILKLIRSMK